MLPLSLLNDFLYCPRRAALKLVEGWREANEHTVRGDIVHEHADLPGYEAAKGVTLLRALPVFSDRLGLNGKCDIVEVHPRPVSDPHPQPLSQRLREGGERPGQTGALCPVEYKKSKRRQFENDDAQLCAQALCLEEMFGQAIERGAVFHAASKRRREVEFTAELRRLTEHAVAELHTMLDSQPSASNTQLPAAVFKPACEECSLYEICLPQITCHPASLAQAAAKLFQT
jgi:CRISPR-associated exonuclease Cas4